MNREAENREEWNSILDIIINMESDINFAWNNDTLTTYNDVLARLNILFVDTHDEDLRTMIIGKRNYIDRIIREGRRILGIRGGRRSRGRSHRRRSSTRRTKTRSRR